MTVADWALVISLCSALVSLASFVWNVWSKFIYPKPSVVVSFQFVTMMTPAPHDAASLTHSENNALSLSATNMGPGAVTLYNVVATYGFSGWLRQKPKRLGLLNPLPHFPEYPGQFEVTAGPFAGGLPKKLEVGEQFSAYFIPDHDSLAKDDVDRIGFYDTFGRYHWAPKSDLDRARKYIREACDAAGKKYD
jgi:hypothetical protein